ncbi:cytokine receptor family member b1 isoform X2 [Danio aesculapii]|nr:cytokine receptor family member b1 isoform X2 [Danio aesculapii]
MKTSSYAGRLFLIHLYFTVIYAIPAPVNFTIWSHNFRHILHWNSGINSPPQTVFNLKQRCGDRKQTEHLNIRNTTMDVSEACEDIYTPCTFFIWASLDNMNSSVIEKRLTPYEDTIIGPPVIFLSGCGDCLNISISLPNESRKKDQLRQFYNSVSFSISWKKHGNNEVRQISIPSKQYVLENLQPGVQYCVRVLPQINSNQNTQPSAWQCEYTSKEEAQRVLYLMSWSLGATLSGSCVMMLAWILAYTGFLCKPKNPPLKSLSNIVPATYLIPEQTLSESVLLTEVQLIHSSYDTTKNNSQLKVKEDSEEKEYEDSVLKEDTEDEEDCNDEDEVKCVYMSCEIDNIGWKNNSTEEDTVSGLPFSTSSRVCYTKEAAMKKTQYDEVKSEKELLSEVFEEGHEHLEVKNTELKTEGNKKGSANTSGNINLFSVTLRTFGPEDDLDKEDVCKPLLSKLILKTDKRTEELLPVSNKISIPIKTDMETDDLIHSDCQNDLIHVCSSAQNIKTKPDTSSGYMATHIGDIHEQNRALLEETNCDTSYITR